MTCDQCGREIYVGDEVLGFDQSKVNFGKGLCFCSFECMKEYAVDNIDDLMDELVDFSKAEDEDPYERYGVSRGDF